MNEEQKHPTPEDKKSLPNGSGFALGLALGVALNNIGAGNALGIVFGAAFDGA